MQSITDRLVPYRTFLDDKKKQISSEMQDLEQQGRQDEANLCKIRLNIVSIFDTVASADERQVYAASDPWTAFCQRYEPRFAVLTAPWRSRLSLAQEHGDLQTQIVEEAKLSMANQIKDVFASLKE